MKIEKISDKQVRITLNQTDLIERNIRFTELVYGSEKSQSLFREMMEQALVECDFDIDTPLMIEAVPLSHDNSIVIIATKISAPEDFSNKLDLFSFANEFKNLVTQKVSDEGTDTKTSNILIFSFSSLDDAINASQRIFGVFDGNSSFYKEKEIYYIVLEDSDDTDFSHDSEFFSDFEAILAEYGQKQQSNIVFKHYLVEHGETIIKSSAINKLSLCF